MVCNMASPAGSHFLWGGSEGGREEGRGREREREREGRIASVSKSQIAGHTLALFVIHLVYAHTQATSKHS